MIRNVEQPRYAKARHGELPVVRLQFRCRGGAREVQLYGQRAAMITFRSFSANVTAVLSQALIAAVHEGSPGREWLSTECRRTRRPVTALSMCWVRPIQSLVKSCGALNIDSILRCRSPSLDEPAPLSVLFSRQAVRSPAIEPVTILVAISFEIDRPDTRSLGDHGVGRGD
jgi:hypothetical protein